MTEAKAAYTRASRVDAACDEFESAWKAGKQPSIDAYVARAEESDRDALRSALAAIEAELRERSVADTSVIQSSVVSSAASTPDSTALMQSTGQSFPPFIGRFSIRDLLGSGAFGKVYRAADPQLGRDVAIKVPLAEVTLSAGEKERFLKEARSAATINHPNVCQIFEVGEHSGQPYIVMAIVPGQSLAEVLKNRKEPLPTRQVAQIVRKIALALSAAHERGVVHRDLKPANVMFDRERKDIVVMDFGLARGPRLGQAHATQSGVIMGTPAYMSPEQARGDSKEVGPAGDIYSLGVILYELLTGTRPFAGTTTEVIGQILHVEPQPPSQRRTEIDGTLEAACLKALAKNPGERFASMKDFAKALEAAARSSSLPGSPAVDTARAINTKAETEAEAAGPQMTEVFAVLSAERKVQQAATAAALEAAVSRSRTPRWVWVALLLTMLGGFSTLGVIVFFAQSDKVRVTVELTDVDLSDKSLSFLLDKRPISAVELAEKIELTPGEHELVVLRGETVVKRLLLTVTGGRKPGIKVRDTTQRREPAFAEHRPVAEWALSVGGQVRVAPPGQLPKTWGEYLALPLLKQGAKLPEGEFKLVGLQLDGPIATDANMSRFHGIDSLHFLWLDHSPITGKGLQNFAASKNLRNLLLHDATKVTDDDSPLIAGFENLEQLQVEGTEITDAGIARFSRLSHLQSLVCGPRVVGTGLSKLGGLSELRQLTVAGQGLTNDGLKNVSEFRQLDWFDINRADSVTDDGLQAIAGLTQLSTLRIGGRRFTNRGLAHLEKLERLTELRLHAPGITDDGLKHLAGMWRLSMLDLEGCEVVGRGLQSLKDCRQLHHLLLGRCPIVDGGLVDVPNSQGLIELLLTSPRVTDDGVVHLEKMRGLKRLHLTDSAVTNDGLLRVQLALPACEITPKPKDDREAAKFILGRGGVVRVAGAPADISAEWKLPSGAIRVTAFNLNFKKNIRDEDLAVFENCTQLREMALDGTGVSDAGLAHFRRCKKLTLINLIDSRLTSTGMENFQECTELKSAWLMGTQLDDAGVAYLAKSKKLELLDLSFTKVSNAGMVHLQGLVHLRTLGLSYTQVTDEGLRTFQSCPSLTAIYLENARVGDAGIANFKNCTELTTINLSGTRVTDEVIATLRTCPKLRVVNLKRTRVSQKAIDEFKAQFPKCKVESGN